MTGFTELIAGKGVAEGGFGAEITEEWLQGRTTYGGLSAALCLEAMARAVPDLPPLRSGLFAFIGPAAGAVRVETAILRRGKSSVFAEATLLGPEGPAARATLCYGAGRDSAYAHTGLPMPAVPPPDDCPLFIESTSAPRFIAHFDVRLSGASRIVTGAAEPETLIWARHRDPEARSLTALVALADVSPPAAMTMFRQFAPISTMTWAVDILDPAALAEDGWYLCRCVGDTVGNGYSSQTMLVWSGDGRPVIAGRQTVALFA